MFREDLENKLKNIFGIKKVSFAAPSDSYEQDTLFVAIDNCTSKAAKGSFISARATGAITLYSQADKTPFCFFATRIERAPKDYKDSIFFFNIDENVDSSPARLQNIYERKCSFVFLWQKQYDPNQPKINSFEIGE